MAYLQAQLKRGFLNSLYRQGAKAGLPLLESLTAFQDNGFAAISTGRLIGSTSGNGKSVSFIMPPVGKQFSEEQVFILSQELLEVYANALVTLAISQPQDNTHDASIIATMLADDSLQTVRSMMYDFTALRFPSLGPTR